VQNHLNQLLKRFNRMSELSENVPTNAPSNDTDSVDFLDYRPVMADHELEQATRQLVRLAIHEDLSDAFDWTTVCLINSDQIGQCNVVAREQGIASGMVMIPWVLDEFEGNLDAECLIDDGTAFNEQQTLVKLRGNARDLLTAERTLLNLLSRLCGIATLTASYVNKMNSQTTRLYDTRKTTPGWRLLEKYAVRCGGASNHRTGLFDGFLIKDNHLALAGTATEALSVADATKRAVKWRGGRVKSQQAPHVVEVEVDTLEQLHQVLPENPDIVLLDNFSLEDLSRAVAIRNQNAPSVQLEASGNVRIETIREIAETGVDRISSGALTHQATSLDLGLDWLPLESSP